MGARIVEDERDPARRISVLIAAVEKSFNNEEARGFLERTVVGPLSRIDDMTEWPLHKKWAWVVRGEWPPVGGTHPWATPGTTYLERFLVPPSGEAEKSFIYEALGGTRDLTEAEKVLDAHWQEAHARVKSTPTGNPQIGVPGGGMSLRAADLVMLGGPLLVVVQALFAVFWVRYWALHISQNQATTPFIFPAFASPVDPLDGPVPRSLAEVTQRLTWLLCLVLPAAVLSFAIITRYDLSVFTEGPPAGTPLLARVFSQRQYDSLSVLLDMINVFGLVASLMAVVQITTVNRAPETVERGRRAIRRVAVFVAILLAASVWLWSAHLERHGPPSVNGIPLRDLVYWVSFGLTWLFVSLVSLSWRAKLPLVVSLFGLLLFFAMFMRT